jgi:hypothetical protein
MRSVADSAAVEVVVAEAVLVVAEVAVVLALQSVAPVEVVRVPVAAAMPVGGVGRISGAGEQVGQTSGRADTISVAVIDRTLAAVALWQEAIAPIQAVGVPGIDRILVAVIGQKLVEAIALVSGQAVDQAPCPVSQAGIVRVLEKVIGRA